MSRTTARANPVQTAADSDLATLFVSLELRARLNRFDCHKFLGPSRTVPRYALCPVALFKRALSKSTRWATVPSPGGNKMSKHAVTGGDWNALLVLLLRAKAKVTCPRRSSPPAMGGRCDHGRDGHGGEAEHT